MFDKTFFIFSFFINSRELIDTQMEKNEKKTIAKRRSSLQIVARIRFELVHWLFGSTSHPFDGWEMLFGQEAKNYTQKQMNAEQQQQQ